MKPIQRRDIIRAVRNRWLEQYKHYPDDQTLGWAQDRTAGSVRTALAVLNLENCSPKDVDAAIGTTGWAKNECDECGNDFPVVLQIGEEPDYEARWQNLCIYCLKKAIDVLNSTNAEP